MDSWNVIALFCEDIRQEERRLHSVMGVMPDNMTVSNVPGVFTRLALYFRMSVAAGVDLGDVSVLFRSIEGDEEQLHTFTGDYIKAQTDKALSEGRAYAGFILNSIMQNVPVPKPGRFEIIVKGGGKEFIAGAVSIKLADAATASPLPAERSSPAT